MRKTLRLRHDAHVRVHGVCTEYGALFDASAALQKTRADLGAHVEDVARLLALQQRSIQDRTGATEQIRQSRIALRDAARTVVKFGKLVNVVDVMMAKMRLPDTASDDELLAYARGLLDRVSAHADAFIVEGLPPDMLQNFAKRIEAFATARSLQSASRERYTAATASIRDTLDRADNTVDAIEAFARTIPGAHPELLTRLRVAKRVGPRILEPPAAPAPAPAPAPDLRTTPKTAA